MGTFYLSVNLLYFVQHALYQSECAKYLNRLPKNFKAKLSYLLSCLSAAAAITTRVSKSVCMRSISEGMPLNGDLSLVMSLENIQQTQMPNATFAFLNKYLQKLQICIYQRQSE